MSAACVKLISKLLVLEYPVIPKKAGIQKMPKTPDSRLHGNDTKWLMKVKNLF